MEVQQLFQIVLVYALTIGSDLPRLETLYVSKPMPLTQCEAISLRMRAINKSKSIMAYCL